MFLIKVTLANVDTFFKNSEMSLVLFYYHNLSFYISRPVISEIVHLVPLMEITSMNELIIIIIELLACVTAQLYRMAITEPSKCDNVPLNLLCFLSLVVISLIVKL